MWCSRRSFAYIILTLYPSVDDRELMRESLAERNIIGVVELRIVEFLSKFIAQVSNDAVRINYFYNATIVALVKIGWPW